MSVLLTLFPFFVLSFFHDLLFSVQFYWIFGVCCLFVLINYADLGIFSEHHHHHHHQVSVGGKPAHKKFSLKRFFRLKSSASTTKTDELRNGLILKFKFDFAHENSTRNRPLKRNLEQKNGTYVQLNKNHQALTGPHFKSSKNRIPVLSTCSQ